MIPNTTHIMHKRHGMTRRLRFMGMTFVILGLIPAAFPFIQAALEWDFGDTWRYTWRPAVSWGLAIALPGSILLAAERWLTRWFVPVPKDRCPRCGYALLNLVRPRCPECGLSVPKCFVRNPETVPVPETERSL